MSLLEAERTLISAQPFSGSRTIYTVPAGTRLRLELLSFRLVTTAAAAPHTPELLFVSQSGAMIMRLQDMDEIGASATVDTTFGIGLTPFSCLTASGMASRAELPDTVLESGATITLRSVDAAGVVIAADAFTLVSLWGVQLGAGGAVVGLDLLPEVVLMPTGAAGV